MNNSGQIKLPRLNWIDYLLLGIASGLAGYSAGMGLGVSETAWLFAGLTAFTTTVSAFIQRYIPRPIAAFDGALYALVGFLCAMNLDTLNSTLPSDGFPTQLRLAGWLCWILAIGSLFTWRDATVLFQAVPGIAIFGMVGSWDTFRASPFLFFGFLLCFATLFARAHGRGMMLRAAESGYQTNALNPDEPGIFWQTLRKGPWRWMAGPEWALGSALAIVLFSLLGAPVFRWSLSSVAGKVQLPVPPTAAMRKQFVSSQGGTNFSGSDALQRVGSGPREKLEKKEIFALSFDLFPYMRYHTYDQYRRGAWQQVQRMTGTADPTVDPLFQRNVLAASRFQRDHFILYWKDGRYDTIPIPGDLENLMVPSNASYRVDGTVLSDYFNADHVQPVDGIVRVPQMTQPLEADPGAVSAVYSDANHSMGIPTRVAQFARKLSANAKTDFDRAEAIRSGIAKTIMYDLNAPAVPAGKDPVEFALFESKRGYCDLFASAMVMMARAVNLPARYVEGFAPFTDPAPHSGVYDFYQTDFHAWAEIYFKNVGWVIFDATDGAKEVEGAGRGASNSSSTSFAASTAALVGEIVLAVLVLSALGWFGLRLWRNGSFVNISKRRAEIEQLYVDLEKSLQAKTGKPRRPSQTASEYVDGLSGLLDGSFALVSEATREFVDTFYGRQDVAPEELQSLRDKIKAARAALKSAEKIR